MLLSVSGWSGPRCWREERAGLLELLGRLVGFAQVSRTTCPASSAAGLRSAAGRRSSVSTNGRAASTAWRSVTSRPRPPSCVLPAGRRRRPCSRRSRAPPASRLRRLRPLLRLPSASAVAASACSASLRRSSGRRRRRPPAAGIASRLANQPDVVPTMPADQRQQDQRLPPAPAPCSAGRTSAAGSRPTAGRPAPARRSGSAATSAAKPLAVS